VRECDRDGDWAITLNQFKWSMDSFSMSLIVMCELEDAE
jgi:hypothetical protein